MRQRRRCCCRFGMPATSWVGSFSRPKSACRASCTTAASTCCTSTRNCAINVARQENPPAPRAAGRTAADCPGPGAARHPRALPRSLNPRAQARHPRALPRSLNPISAVDDPCVDGGGASGSLEIDDLTPPARCSVALTSCSGGPPCWSRSPKWPYSSYPPRAPSSSSTSRAGPSTTSPTPGNSSARPTRTWPRSARKRPRRPSTRLRPSARAA